MTLRRTALAVAVASVAVLGLAAPASATPSQCAPSRNADALRQSISVLGEEASGALIRYSGPTGCFRGSNGVSDIATGRGIREDSRYRIGSMTKTFTTVAVLQLAAQGRVDLDETVQHYLPGYLPDSYAPIKVRHLLNYTSGLQGLPIDHKDPTWFLAHRFDTWAPGSQIDRSRPLAFTPGTMQKYDNSGHIVAGLIIEKVTGRPYADAVKRGIINRLGLHATSVPGTCTGIPGPHAKGYELIDGRYVDITEANPTYQWSAAEIISNAPDLETFMVALVTGKLLPPAQQSELMTVPDVKMYNDPTQDAVYGAGIMRLKLGRLVLWGKTGDRPGYQSATAVSEDGSLRLSYSINTLHMGGERTPMSEKIVAAALR
ncbi:serine hydrolase domain-containing protein [Longispora sp. K20-0274]|uniref:serine hydrolase domain-containing protein n=1 Tax=Longispora sp. K20-0274 TaxID=3088255 RepID=UPI00399A0480